MPNNQLKHLSNYQLLEELGKRIRSKEIEGLNTDFSSLHIRKYPNLAINSESDNKVIFVLYLNTGKTENKEIWPTMKCKECNSTTRTLRYGMCRSCLNARSYPIEAFSDEQLLEELKKRKSQLLADYCLNNHE